jgi:hypothetical protein
VNTSASGPIPDLEVLAPPAAIDEERLELGRLGRPGSQRVERPPIVAPISVADRGRRILVAAGALLDHALEHRDRETSRRRLHDVQVDRREEPGPVGPPQLGRRVRRELVERAETGPSAAAPRPPDPGAR